MCHSGLEGSDVAGVILAGGRSQRMGGGDKAFLPLAGRPMIAHVIERLQGQTAALVINTNSPAAGFEQFGLPLTADLQGDYAGPLAGVLTGLRWAQEHCPAARWIATAACDTPFLPGNYVAALRQAAAGAGAAIAIAASGGRSHHVLGLWDVRLAGDLAAQLAEGARKVQLWVERHSHIAVDFPSAATGDPFFNVNTPDDLALAARLLRGEAA
jgi:molybdopterin-guanine dinucleotide biosynthesis protein A